MLKNILKALSRKFQTAPVRNRSARPPRRRPSLEVLEDRLAPVVDFVRTGDVFALPSNQRTPDLSGQRPVRRCRLDAPYA